MDVTIRTLIWFFTITSQFYIFGARLEKADFQSRAAYIYFYDVFLVAYSSSALIEIGLAVLLLYSMFSLRFTLQHNGLSDRFNVQNFMCNAALFSFYSIAMTTWFVEFVLMSKRYYNVDCTAPGASPTCDIDRANEKNASLLIWLGVEIFIFIANLALATILFNIA